MARFSEEILPIFPQKHLSGTARRKENANKRNLSRAPRVRCIEGPQNDEITYSAALVPAGSARAEQRLRRKYYELLFLRQQLPLDSYYPCYFGNVRKRLFVQCVPRMRLAPSRCARLLHVQKRHFAGPCKQNVRRKRLRLRLQLSEDLLIRSRRGMPRG